MITASLSGLVILQVSLLLDTVDSEAAAFHSNVMRTLSSVVQTLEERNVPFTGATSEFYEPTREQMKRACVANGISTPAFLFARDELDVERAAATLRFPLFVKHYSSYASVDISRRSRAVTPAGLRQQARKIISRHGMALIEEYIDGTECTVLVD